MNIVTALSDQIDRLVHPSALGTPMDASLHRTFIATRFAVSLVAVATIPLLLVAGHVPRLADVMVIAALILPILAVAHVSKTGKLLEGEVLSLASWLILAFSLCLGGIGGPSLAIGLFLVMLLEANLSASFTLVSCTMLVVLAATLSVLAAASANVLPFGVARTGTPVFLSLAAMYGAALTFEGSRCRKLARARETLDAERYRLLSESIGDLVMRFDGHGLVHLASQSSERLFGIKSHELMRRGFLDRIHVADRPLFLTMIRDAAVGTDHVTATLRFRVRSQPSPDGRYDEPVFVWLELRSRRVDGGDLQDLASLGAPSVMTVARDVTSRILHEEDQERAKCEAEAASAWKDRFLATVSHELRTPLNAIVGFGEILASPAHLPTDTAKRLEYASIIHSSGLHLLSVVNSLLDLSKIDLGRLDLTFEPVDLTDLIGSCCDMVGLAAEQGGVALHRDIEPTGPITGDKRACKQILINLLSNALKFTPRQGSVTVRLRPDGDGVELVVSDTGIGMEPADLAQIGDPFFQADTGYDRRFEGTGLGLSVVRGLVGLHGGRITVDSTPKVGTTMRIRLPRDGKVNPQPARTKIEVMPRTERVVALRPDLARGGRVLTAYPVTSTVPREPSTVPREPSTVPREPSTVPQGPSKAQTYA